MTAACWCPYCGALFALARAASTPAQHDGLPPLVAMCRACQVRRERLLWSHYIATGDRAAATRATRAGMPQRQLRRPI